MENKLKIQITIYKRMKIIYNITIIKERKKGSEIKHGNVSEIKHGKNSNYYLQMIKINV